MCTEKKVWDRWCTLKNRASQKRIPFNLSLLSVRNLLQAKRCFYTKAPLTDKQGDMLLRTIDRVDPSKGYVKGNVVACSFLVNTRKGNLSPSEIVALSYGVSRKR